MPSVADRLYSYRHAYRKTQQEVADALGVSQRTIGRWERRESEPAPEQLLRIFELFAGPPAGWSRIAGAEDRR